MRKNHLYQVASLMLMMLFFNHYTAAQSIIFSSDQWPKRWERAMHHQPMNGRFEVPRHFNKQDFRQVNQTKKKVQGWGKQRSENHYKRSRTPDYNYQTYKQFRYQQYPLYGYGQNHYQSSLATPYHFGNGIYPHSYSPLGLVGYPLSAMGLSYPSPLFMAPGLHPGGLTHNVVYPW